MATCERCGVRPATVHKVRIENGVRTEKHLCESCARETGEWPELNVGPSWWGSTLGDFIKSFFDLPGPEAPAAELPGRTRQRCPNCGLSWSDFKRLGQLGCSRCYETFERELVPVLKRLHGATDHTGKHPHQRGEAARRRTLERLREELRQAIEAEQYERAAQLRDQIRALERGAS